MQKFVEEQIQNLAAHVDGERATSDLPLADDLVLARAEYYSQEGLARARESSRSDSPVLNGDSAYSRHAGAPSNRPHRVSSSSTSSGRMKFFPMGLPVETTDLDRDDKHGKSRVKAASRASQRQSKPPPRSPIGRYQARSGDSYRVNSGPADHYAGFRPRSSHDAASFEDGAAFASTDTTNGNLSLDRTSLPWLSQDPKRRFSSPLLTKSDLNGSVTDLAAASVQPPRRRQHPSSASSPRPDLAIAAGRTDNLRLSTQSQLLSSGPYATRARLGATHDYEDLRSPSPSRQSFHTAATSDRPNRESRGWRRSFWNMRSATASASVLSFPHSGSMVEMHLGMSQDRHDGLVAHRDHHPYYQHQQPAWAVCRTTSGAASTGDNRSSYAGSREFTTRLSARPDAGSALDEAGGISPDEAVHASTYKQRKKKQKGFKRLISTLLGSHATGPPSRSATTSPSDTATLGLDTHHFGDLPPSSLQSPTPTPHSRQTIPDSQEQRSSSRLRVKRESSLTYAAALETEDFSAPLAPPPPLSFLTGQQSSRRSVSSSSQSSLSPVLPAHDSVPSPSNLFFANHSRHSLGRSSVGQQHHLSTQQRLPGSHKHASNSYAPGATATSMIVSTSGNSFASPSTSSSDLNRVRPSSATSWLSSFKTGSPRSPQEAAPDAFESQTWNAPSSQRNPQYEVHRHYAQVHVQPQLQVPQHQHLLRDPQVSATESGPVLRREKSLPALPDSTEVTERSIGQKSFPVDSLRAFNGNGLNGAAMRDKSAPSGTQARIVAEHESMYHGLAGDPYRWQAEGGGSRYSPDMDGRSSLSESKKALTAANHGKQQQQGKSISRLFGLGGRRSRGSSVSQSSQNDVYAGSQSSRNERLDRKTPHAGQETTSHGSVRDSSDEPLAYR